MKGSLNNMTLKERFVQELEDLTTTPRIITVAVKLPSGAVEVITNYEDVENKAFYYIESYDRNFRLYNNPKVEIVGYMVI